MKLYISALQKKRAFLKKICSLYEYLSRSLEKESVKCRDLLHSRLCKEFPELSIVATSSHFLFYPRFSKWEDLINNIPLLKNASLLRVFDLSFSDAKEITYELGANIPRLCSLCGPEKFQEFSNNGKINFSKNVKVTVPLDDDFESNLIELLHNIINLLKSLDQLPKATLT